MAIVVCAVSPWGDCTRRVRDESLIEVSVKLVVSGRGLALEFWEGQPSENKQGRTLLRNRLKKSMQRGCSLRYGGTVACSPIACHQQIYTKGGASPGWHAVMRTRAPI